MSSRTDSQQLQRLRYSFVYAWGVRATPARLGTFAAEKQRTITDFGNHSQRWIRTFREAHARETARIALYIQHLT
jgi:hypothetical protein